MDNIEMIEKLREKADVTYDEAKEILESLNWNMLDALIALEKEGKLKKTENSSYTTKQETPENFDNFADDKNRESFGSVMKKIFRWIGNVLSRGMDNKLCIANENSDFISIPLTILAVLMIPAFWLIVIALCVAFFTGCTFSIEGPDLGTEKVNSVMSKIKFNCSKK